jgi:hypothetical protein
VSLTLTACAGVFESEGDIQARQALRDLMAVQEKFHTETGKYAKNFVEIEKYNLKYHSGIVYLEIESADKDKYRAIALPAESLTARVFAYDTGKGGYYEMGDDEVSQYVLGALKHIRKTQREKRIVDAMSILLIVVLVGLGFKVLAPPEHRQFKILILGYFCNIPPLGWAMSAFNHMNKNIVFTPQIKGYFITALVLAVVGLVTALASTERILRGRIAPPVASLSVCGALLSVFSFWALAFLWLHR